MKYKVRFSLYHKPLSDGTKTIRVRVTWAGQRFDSSLPCAVPSGVWNSEKQRAVGPSKLAAVCNRCIVKTEAAVDSVFARADLAGVSPTANDLRSALGVSVVAPASPLVQDALAEFIETQSTANSWVEGTIKRFQSLGAALAEYDPLLNVEQLATTPKLEGFTDHLYNVRGMQNTTVNKSLSLLRWFLRWCLGRGLLKSNTFDTYRPRLKGVDGTNNEIIYLTPEELRAVYNVKLYNIPELEEVRDVFCFCCFTGLRWSDAYQLRDSNVVAGRLKVVTKKTAAALSIELNQYAQAILEKYSGHLPHVSNQKMNKHLKEVCRLAGLNSKVSRVWYIRAKRCEEVVPKWRVVSSHAARRTFVVSALRLGIPAEVIMSWTGHKNYRAMRPYIAIVDDLKSESMAKFNTLI